MYLSKIVFDPRSREALRTLADSYAQHQLIYAAFPEGEAIDRGRVLYRVEVPSRGIPHAYGDGSPLALVQSETEPSWESLLGPGRPLACAGYKPFSPAFTAGQLLRFRLRANPTVRKWAYRQDKPDGKRVGLYKEAEQIAWLERKGQRGGFFLVEAHITDHGKVSGRKPTETGVLRLEHLAITFDGVLRVTDPILFRQTLENGIGTAKGFGFGLLSVAQA